MTNTKCMMTCSSKVIKVVSYKKVYVYLTIYHTFAFVAHIVCYVVVLSKKPLSRNLFPPNIESLKDPRRSFFLVRIQDLTLTFQISK